MKVARLFGANDLRIVNMYTPAPGDGEVLCKVERCGICGTDYSIFKGAFKTMIRYPMTLGHEWSGVVEKTGRGTSGFAVGDKVSGDTCISCGVCYECLVGNYINCENLRSVGTIHAWDGAYSEYVIFPARHLFKLPDEVDFDNGAMLEPAATAMLGVDQAKVKTGDYVVVHGTGTIGIAAAKIAKLAGAAKVIITGRKEFKLRKAIEMGIDYAIHTVKENVAESVMKMFNGQGADAVIEASGDGSLLRDSLNLVSKGGGISVISIFDKTVEIDVDKMIFNNIRILPVTGNIGMNKRTLRLMESGQLDMRPVITGRCKLDEVPEMLKNLKNNNEMKIKTMIDFS